MAAQRNAFLDSLFTNPAYLKWIDFWHRRIGAIDGRGMTLSLTDSSELPPAIPRGETVRAEIKRDSSRGVPMIFSPDGKSFVALHYHGMTDPSFNIVGLSDSTFTYVTLGPASFFDAAVWLSNTNLAVLGFTFYPSSDPAKGTINMTILDYDFTKHMEYVYTGRDLSWQKYGRYMDERAFERSGR